MAPVASTPATAGKKATKKGSASAEKTKQTTPGTLEHKAEKLILQSLVPPYSVGQSFRQYCDNHRDTLGKRGVDRRRSQKRRVKLRELQLNNYRSFKRHCSKYKVNCPATLNECLMQAPDTDSEYEDEDEDEENNDESTVLSATLISPEIKSCLGSTEMSNHNPFRPRMILGSTPNKGGETGKCPFVFASFIARTMKYVSSLYLLSIARVDWSDLGGVCEQFTLNFNNIEENRNGFLCIRPQSIAVLDERVDGFVVFKCLSDPRLLLDPENFEAKMLSDGSGMMLKEPALSTCFTDDIEAMELTEESYPSGNCDRVFEELRMRVAENGSDKWRKHRYTIIKFPDNMKGTNLYFNKTMGHLKENKLNLDTNPRFLDQTFDNGHGVKFDFVTTYVYWKVAVDGSQRNANEKTARASLDDLFKEALIGLKRTSMSSNAE